MTERAGVKGGSVEAICTTGKPCDIDMDFNDADSDTENALRELLKR